MDLLRFQPASDAATPAAAQRPAEASHLRWPVAGAGVLLLAIASTAWVPTPQFDPYGWLLWGREIWSGTPVFNTVDYPSWKPLGALLAVPAYAVGGSAAPTAWLVLERVLALFGLVLAFDLGRALGGRLAAVLAAGGVVLLAGWVEETLDGRLEPAVATLLLMAAWSEQRRRPTLAVAVLATAALARPEAYAVALAYAWYCARREHRLALGHVVLLAAVPALWLAGDLIGAGSAFHGGTLAKWAATVERHGGAPSPLAALAATWRGAVPIFLVAAVGSAVVLRSRMSPLPRMIGAAAIVWLVVETALAVLGYPTDARFLLPPLVLITIVGAPVVAAAVRYLFQPRRGGRVATVMAAAGGGLVLLASSAPAALQLDTQADEAGAYATDTASLRQLLGDLPSSAVAPCAPAVAQAFQAPLAWYTDRPIAAVKRPLDDGVAFLGGGALETIDNLVGPGRSRTLDLFARAREWHAVFIQDGIRGDREPGARAARCEHLLARLVRKRRLAASGRAHPFGAMWQRSRGA
jgi:hypothetical protein